MADIQFISIIGLLGVLLGVFIRTAWPYLRKKRLTEYVDIVFEKNFLYLAVGALIASASFYLSIGPFTNHVIIEPVIALLLGLAGNDIFNEVYQTIANYNSQKA
jgi:hypothetical protein